MLKILKFKPEDLYIWSDMHWNHDPVSWDVPIWKLRGYDSSEDHKKGLIDSWNLTCNNQTTVIHLGDIIFGMDGEKNLTSLLHTLNFKDLYLLPGNHLAGYKQLYYKALEGKQGDLFPLQYNLTPYKTVYFVPNLFQAYVGKQGVVFSHWPQRCWDGYAKGTYNLHGHCHGRYVPGLPETVNQGKYLDVGVDVFSAPVPWSRIKEIMDTKSIFLEDHHTDKTQNPFN